MSAGSVSGVDSGAARDPYVPGSIVTSSFALAALIAVMMLHGVA
jgi:hypothetical protein